MSRERVELLVATGNRKKLGEIRELLNGIDLRVTSLADYKALPKVIEDGRSFRENAVKKACVAASATGKFVLGEDSGLEVPILNNRPGVLSARYALPDGAAGSVNAPDRQNNLKLLRELKGVPLKKRSARYRCCVALADAHGLIDVVCGSCSGLIALKPRGEFGFGYDPLFFIELYGQTFAQLGAAVKHKMSHRYKALCKARRIIILYLRGHRAASS